MLMEISEINNLSEYLHFPTDFILLLPVIREIRRNTT